MTNNFNFLLINNVIYIAPPQVDTWPLSKVNVHHMRETGKFLKTLRWWPVTLGAIGAFALYPALTEDFKKNPFGLFGEDE